MNPEAKGKIVHPYIHDFMYFLKDEFFQNIKVVDQILKNWKLLKFTIYA